jgi:rod shape-determining protein MreC
MRPQQKRRMSLIKWLLAASLVIVLLWVMTGLHGVEWFLVKIMPGINDRANHQSQLKNDKSELVAEVETLKKQNEELKITNSTLEEQLNSIQSAAKLTEKWASSKQIQSINARIILKDPYHLYSSFLIDTGSNKGVKKGMLVVGEDAVIGRIIDVHPDFSRVRTVESPRLSFGAVVRRTRELGVVTGGRRGMILSYLSINSDIKVGDQIITSGTTDITPAGLLIGNVTEVVKREKDEELEARIELPRDLDKLENVRVVLNIRNLPAGSSLGEDNNE